MATAAKSRAPHGYYYDDDSGDRDKIDYGKRRIWELLQKKYLGSTDHEGFAYFWWLNDLGDLPQGQDQEDTLTANMDLMRFQITITRKQS